VGRASEGRNVIESVAETAIIRRASTAPAKPSGREATLSESGQRETLQRKWTTYARNWRKHRLREGPIVAKSARLARMGYCAGSQVEDVRLRGWTPFKLRVRGSRVLSTSPTTEAERWFNERVELVRRAIAP
jgi:hypothetical protein